MRESDILHEAGEFWVLSQKNEYTVFENNLTHSHSRASFQKNEDGLSCAVSYCEYLASRRTK